ncbi:hypothetical protein PAXINDRAFT_157829 [Paxillus involutus ATCC 200175]|uniref:Uncharacterized protein n=1 Tax=Paxillus involutus ATCC 200175 TaxID=664439 RepID=A0A0C9TFS3_PAXIN|nr:hypothetical protein PAXINDRAFT_157829 [Paxillus involutus ATCC 200175]
MRFSLITIICALAAYATAVAVPGPADVFERDEDGCCKATAEVWWEGPWERAGKVHTSLHRPMNESSTLLAVGVDLWEGREVVARGEFQIRQKWGITAATNGSWNW